MPGGGLPVRMRTRLTSFSLEIVLTTYCCCIRISSASLQKRVNTCPLSFCSRRAGVPWAVNTPFFSKRSWCAVASRSSREQDDPVFGKVQQVIAQPDAFAGIQPTGGFVKHQDFGVVEQSRRNPDPPVHPSGKLADFFFSSPAMPTIWRLSAIRSRASARGIPFSSVYGDGHQLACKFAAGAVRIC